MLTLAYFDAEATGEVTIAQRLATAPVGLVVASLAPVIMAQMGVALRAGKSADWLVRKWLRRLIPGGVLVALVLLLVPSAWVAFVLGDSWDGVGDYLGALALMMGSQLVAGPLSQVLVLQGRARLQLVWDLVRFVCLLLVSTFVAMASESPVAMIWSASITLALFYIVYLILVLSRRREVLSTESE